MASKIIDMSDRGQITLPKELRKTITTKHFTYRIGEENGQQVIVLTPMQTREEFFAELEAAEKDWEKNGGLTLNEMKKKYNLNA